jgi:hypothetical protein
MFKILVQLPYPYRELSLIDLIGKIVNDNDNQALEEFHKNRGLLIYSDEPGLRFVEFITLLREGVAKRKWPGYNAVELAEKAYDLTLDKFNHIPAEPASLVSAGSEEKPAKKSIGIDCRFYFKAFLKKAVQSFEKMKPAGQIELEALSAAILHGFVSRHFYLSRLEAERHINPFWSRYNWKINGKTICVRLPVSLKGRQRSKWLNEHIKDCNPQKPNERRRIQRIIYQRFLKETLISTSDKDYLLNTELCSASDATDDRFGTSLAQKVAREKADNIDLLRPTIGRLGKEKLKKLILRIFEDISQGELKDGKVAKEFGLSKATFSRFAGVFMEKKG